MWVCIFSYFFTRLLITPSDFLHFIHWLHFLPLSHLLTPLSSCHTPLTHSFTFPRLTPSLYPHRLPCILPHSSSAYSFSPASLPHILIPLLQRILPNHSFLTPQLTSSFFIIYSLTHSLPHYPPSILTIVQITQNKKQKDSRIPPHNPCMRIPFTLVCEYEEGGRTAIERGLAHEGRGADGARREGPGDGVWGRM